jgi:hypothetical protein
MRSTNTSSILNTKAITPRTITTGGEMMLELAAYIVIYSCAIFEIDPLIVSKLAKK